MGRGFWEVPSGPGAERVRPPAPSGVKDGETANIFSFLFFPSEPPYTLFPHVRPQAL